MADDAGQEPAKRKRPEHLKLVDTSLDDTTSAERGDPGPVPETVKHDASSVIGNAVMYAAMSWVACCAEQAGVSVTVSALGGGLFDAEVALADGASLYLRVTLILESGPRLRTVVEPMHP